MTTSMTLRFDDTFKKEIDQVSKDLGISTSAAFTVFAKKYVARRGFPFSVTVSTPQVPQVVSDESVSKWEKSLDETSEPISTMDDAHTYIEKLKSDASRN